MSVPEIRRVTLNLTDDDISDLKLLAERKGSTMTHAIRRAIAMAKFVDDSIASGDRLLIESPDKTIHLLVVK